jgi:heavy metal translocating P-type ATPase
MNEVVLSAEPSAGLMKLRIAGMDCGSCAMTIENSVRQLPGVTGATVSFTTETMEVSGSVTRAAVEARLRELGYRLATEEPGARAPMLEQHGASGFVAFLWAQPVLRRALLVAAAVIAGTVLLPLIGVERAFGLPALDVLFGAGVMIAGAPVFLKGFRALLFARRVTIDLLMAVAAVGAVGIGETGEAVTVILLFMLGEALEAYSAERARDSLRSLMALQPQEATVLEAHAPGHDTGHHGDHAHDGPCEPRAHEHHDHDEHEGHAHEHHEHHGRHEQHAHDGHEACTHERHAHDQHHGHDVHRHGAHRQQAKEHDECCGEPHHGHAAAPAAADDRHDHNDGHPHEAHDHQLIRPVSAVRVGDRVLVRPGQRIPVDGVVLKGTSSVNQAPVTGENVPVIRNPGDEVMAGTVNGEAALEIRVTRLVTEGTIARIARLVEQAQAQRSPAERFIDRFARYYTPAVVLLATLVVAIPVLALSQPLLDSPDGTRGWLYRGLTLLIIACPCALVISIPVTVVSGLTRLAQLGVLVKSGALLDRLADIRIVAFDKTGTLTHGKPVVASARTNNCSHAATEQVACRPCDEVMTTAAAVERASEHPVAHAIVSAARARNGGRHLAAARNVEAHPGRGVSGMLENGDKVTVGNHLLFSDQQQGWQQIHRHAQAAEQAGQTVMYVAQGEEVVGYIGVQDAVRDDSGAALAELRAMSPPVRTVMLTGDNPQAAARVAEQIHGISEVRAGLLPEQKLAAIEELGGGAQAVAMVGDGINDAPALARADVGIAMGGGGTAQAMETADVVLMQDDLSHVPVALRMARSARRIVKQNIALSLGLKLAFLALAVPGITTLWMAVVADVGATMLVTLNGMRLLRRA